jgi:hypothetical protein
MLLQLFKREHHCCLQPELPWRLLMVGGPLIRILFHLIILRNSEHFPSESHHSLLTSAVEVSLREREKTLEMFDFSWIGEKNKSVNITNLTAKPSSSLQKPTNDEGKKTSSWMFLRDYLWLKKAQGMVGRVSLSRGLHMPRGRKLALHHGQTVYLKRTPWLFNAWKGK